MAGLRHRYCCGVVGGRLRAGYGSFGVVLGVAEITKEGLIKQNHAGRGFVVGRKGPSIIKMNFFHL